MIWDSVAMPASNEPIVGQGDYFLIKKKKTNSRFLLRSFWNSICPNFYFYSQNVTPRPRE